jgi:hypothetical protein
MYLGTSCTSGHQILLLQLENRNSYSRINRLVLESSRFCAIPNSGSKLQSILAAISVLLIRNKNSEFLDEKVKYTIRT